MTRSWLGLCCEQLGWELFRFSRSTMKAMLCSVISLPVINSSALVKRISLLGAFSNSGNSPLVQHEVKARKFLPRKDVRHSEEEDAGWEWTCALLWLAELLRGISGFYGLPEVVGQVFLLWWVSLFLSCSWLLGRARWGTNCPPWIHLDFQNPLQRCDWNYQQICLHQEWVCIQPANLWVSGLWMFPDILVQEVKIWPVPEFQTEFGIVFWGKSFRKRHQGRAE